MAKIVTFDVEARQALKKGIDIVASSVRITLGPKGRNVVSGANPMQLKIGIEKAVEAIVDEIKRLSVPVKGHEDVAHVAAISSQNEQIGSLIADAMDKVGKDGVITVEDNQA